ncbi:MsnO8 family LLM class oxidoreductase [Corynebacterium guangdongense]|uniref:Luciferase family oxidoreductase group 1 n=1 Tax=Corynebacterium guangdongense TaxID=1783348 RepID=A0ABU1ZYX5_9CORY|nr:MsnO8 family LLM class oxidoreductase [Corynebacterium guangdongense]MDR7330143.1 luciferase family oxidoreductase group 1 [Corynebacterium guangdongense]WJZ18701.1 Alkanal monooxygenase alpha chain [Corynebacterium guangdongense]
MRFSVLDRAHSLAGESESETLRSVVAHARDVEKLGFGRFFTAEHHAVPGIAGSQPALLAAAVGAATETIRVGTAGIMLPSHPPLIVAEQIAVLEALFPGRVDAGVGNSVGFTGPVRGALRQGEPVELKKRYADDLAELMAFLSGEGPVTARPANDGATPLWVLAGFRSLSVAAELGLRVIVGGPSLVAGEGRTHEGLEQYRRRFIPSANAPEPEVIVSLDLAVADTEEAARDLLLPQIHSTVISRRTGSFEHLARVADIDHGPLSGRERQRIREGLEATVHGTPAQVREELKRIVAYTGSDDVLITAGMSDPAGRARSEELLAGLAD